MSSAASFADALALSAHKFYGPKGSGALLVRHGLDLDPLLHGAAQEYALRGGTHNVAGIVGLASAAHHARRDQPRESARLARLRDSLWNRIQGRVDRVHWNGEGAGVLPNTLNMSFEGCPSPRMCEEMDRRGFAISAGAACLSDSVTPSHNVLAMGLPEGRALTSVRVSLGHSTTEYDVHDACTAFVEVAAAIRSSI